MFTDVSEERIASVLRVEEIAKEASGPTANKRTLPAASMLDLMFAPEVERILSSETKVSNSVCVYVRTRLRC
jgi:hypothetical protein